MIEKLPEQDLQLLISNPKDAVKFILSELVTVDYNSKVSKSELNRVIMFAAELYGLYPALNERQLIPSKNIMADMIKTDRDYGLVFNKDDVARMKQEPLYWIPFKGTDLFFELITDLEHNGPLSKSIKETNDNDLVLEDDVDYTDHQDAEDREWVKNILARDTRCVVCGVDEKIETHHLFGYRDNPGLRSNEGNGVGICKWCHSKYHRLYGKLNINPVDFVEFVREYGVKW